MFENDFPSLIQIFSQQQYRGGFMCSVFITFLRAKTKCWTKQLQEGRVCFGSQFEGIPSILGGRCDGGWLHGSGV